MAPRLLVLCALSSLGCQPDLSAATFKLVPLPPDIMTGPARAGVQTKEGRIFAVPLTGGLLRLPTDGGLWEELPAPAMTRFMPDFKEGLTLAQGENTTGLFRASGEIFTALTPTVPAPTAGFPAVLGRDATGQLWASSAPRFATEDAGVVLAHFDSSSGGEWQYDEVPIPFMQGAISLRPTMTSDARFFFRPDQSGLWEIDLPNHALVQRVTCEHELFRASAQTFMPCQEETFIFAGLGGELFLLNPNHELWRVPARATTPALVVKGTLPKLEGRLIGAPATYVDPKGRVWLGFRRGENVDADTSSLYVAEPGKRDGWLFLKGELPRAIALFGDAEAPLISSTSQNTGLLMFRVAD